MKPLNGVRILDLTSYFSGPFCTRMLGDLGAEIVKIENPPFGDQSRFATEVGDHSSAIYSSRNRGKKSVIINMKDERQKKIFLELVKTADAVISNFKPGNMERLGLDHDVLKNINPAIVDTRISGFGQTGAWRDRAAFDGVVQASSGVVSVTGPVGTPVKVGFSVADATAGVYGAMGTLAALFDAKRTGEGRLVDVSMLDGLLAMEETLVANYFVNEKIPQPMGNHHTTATCFGDYKFKDGERVFISCGSDKSFQGLAKLLGHPEWAEEGSKYASMPGRTANRDELEKMVEEELLKHDSVEFCKKMQENNLPYGPIYNLKQILESEVVADRNMVVTAKYPTGQEYRVTGNPVKMSGMEQDQEYAAVPLGYNTFEILSQCIDEATLHEIYDPLMAQCQAESEAKYAKMKVK